MSHKPWSLQTQLTAGILGIMVLLLIFFGVAGPLWWQVNQFFSRSLRLELALVRDYGQLVTLWTRVHDRLPDDPVSLLKSNLPLVSSESWRLLDGMTREILEVLEGFEPAPDLEEDKKQFLKIDGLMVSYKGCVANLERSLKVRNEKVQKGERHVQEILKLSHSTEQTLERFSLLQEDIRKRLHPVDESVSGSEEAEEFSQCVDRLEKDLSRVQMELRGLKKLEGNTDFAETERNVNKWLSAIVHRIRTTRPHVQTPWRIKALSSIQENIERFKNEFITILEQRVSFDGEIVELNDSITKLRQEAEIWETRGLSEILAESERLWQRTTKKAQSIQDRSLKAYNLSMGALLLVFVAGLFFLALYPKRIGGALRQLMQKILTYEIGDSLGTLPDHGSQEIVELSGAFADMAERLKGQVETISKYTRAIDSMGEAFSSLYQSPRESWSRDRGLAQAVRDIIGQAIALEGCEFAKVLICDQRDFEVRVGEGARKESRKALVRLGEDWVSEKFVVSDEYKDYLESMKNCSFLTDRDHREEFFSRTEGISGWLLEIWDAPMGRAQGVQENVSLYSDRDFLKRNQKIPVVGEIKTLAERRHEMGLKGAVFGVKLPRTDAQTTVEGQAIHAEQYLGLLFLYFPNPSTQISEQDRLFAQILGRQISEVVRIHALMREEEEKRKMEFHLSLAKEIQENLITKKGQPGEDVKLTWIFKPAGEVGGDCYFTFDPDEQETHKMSPEKKKDYRPTRLGVVIADASGKNVSAALLMTMFKTAISSLELQAMDPGEVLTRVNHIIYENILPGKFITAQYVIMNMKTGVVQLASAGHMQAIRVSEKGREPRIAALGRGGGIPLGIDDGEVYQSEKFPMNPGDLLCIYTDGVLEAKNQDRKEFGIERLQKFLLHPHGDDPCKALLAEIELFAGNAPQHDDITAVMLKWMGRKV